MPFICGTHGDAKTVKLISCLYGRIYVVVVNNDPDSSQYRKWQDFSLSDTNRMQIRIPVKFGNAFFCNVRGRGLPLQADDLLRPPGQFTLRWNDPAYKFSWPIGNPIVSQRDAGAE